MDYTLEQIAEFFEYLDALREGGETNMSGARPYLADEFDMGKNDSSAILSLWMKSFDPAKTPLERATARPQHR